MRDRKRARPPSAPRWVTSVTRHGQTLAPDDSAWLESQRRPGQEPTARGYKEAIWRSSCLFTKLWSGVKKLSQLEANSGLKY